MKNVTAVTNNRQILALVFAAAIGLAATNASAADATEATYDNVTVTSQLSANGAKRLTRRFLLDRGFVYGVGPGAARVKSITRDADTWIIRVVYSNGGYVASEQAILYIDTNTAALSEVAPVREPQQLAAQ